LNDPLDKEGGAEVSTLSPNLQEQQRVKLLQPDMISGSEMLLRSLLLEDVDCVFGYPGGAVLYIYDAIYDFAGLRHLLARHEQGAIHAADGYARASGKTGVCIATSGPGATNLITGIAMAYQDNIPMVIITGNVPLSSRGSDAFQEADVIGMTLPITKHNYYITDVEDIPAVVRAAFHIANSGRKGPVLIDIPKDISSQKKAFHYKSPDFLSPNKQLEMPVNETQIDTMLQELERASKPLLVCGEGIHHASAYHELLDFAVKANIPVALTSHGVGGFPQSHPLALGFIGQQGNSVIREALLQCDLLIVVGMNIDPQLCAEFKQLSPEARIIHMDYDDYSQSDLIIHVGCYGDPAQILSMAAQKLKTRSVDWINRLPIVLNNKVFSDQLAMEQGQTRFTLAVALNLISDSVTSRVVVTVDEKLYHTKIVDCFEFTTPRSLVFPIGLEAPGFSLPAAIGAQMAFPERTIISINGEAGIHKCTQELAVCAIHNIALKIVVFSKKASTQDNSPDFVKLADAYGLKGLKAESCDEARDVWMEAMNIKGPVLIEFVIEQEI
jgi:acetolactate synthase-1/2/3 large subunit